MAQSEVNILRELGHYIGRWCPGSLYLKVISSYGIDYKSYYTRNCRLVITRIPLTNRKNLNNPCDLDLWPIDTPSYASDH